MYIFLNLGSLPPSQILGCSHKNSTFFFHSHKEYLVLPNSLKKFTVVFTLVLCITLTSLIKTSQLGLIAQSNNQNRDIFTIALSICAVLIASPWCLPNAEARHKQTNPFPSLSLYLFFLFVLPILVLMLLLHHDSLFFNLLDQFCSSLLLSHPSIMLHCNPQTRKKTAAPKTSPPQVRRSLFVSSMWPYFSSYTIVQFKEASTQNLLTTTTTILSSSTTTTTTTTAAAAMSCIFYVLLSLVWACLAASAPVVHDSLPPLATPPSQYYL